MTHHTPRYLALAAFALCAATFLPGLGASVRAQTPQPGATPSPAEVFVLTQFKEGREADFNDSKQWQPQNPGEPHVIRGDFLEQLLSGSVEGLKFGPKGLVIKGAVVEGPLDLRNEKIPFSVSLISCTFRNRVSFIHVSIKGDFNISGDPDRYARPEDDPPGSVFENQFWFINVTVDGDIYARKSVFKWKPPPCADCNEAYAERDAADFEEAKVSNDAVFDGAQFEGPADFEGGHFAQVLFARKALFKDLANFVDVRVKDDLDLSNSTFVSGADFSRAVVENEFNIAGTTFEEPTDKVVLQDMNVGVLTLREKLGLLGFAGKPHISGLTYKRISRDTSGDKPGEPHNDEKVWDAWLGLLEQTEYTLDGYTALESFEKGQGYAGRADACYIAQRDKEAGAAYQRSRLRGVELWCWDSFLKYTVGYGRWPWLALIYSIIIIGVGCLVFPKDKMETLKKDEKEKKQDEKEPKHGRKGPKYSPFWYSLDLFLPVVDLHASQMWVPIWPDAQRQVRYRDYPKFAALVVISAAKNVLKFARILKTPRPTSPEAQAVKDKVRWHYMHVHALLGWVLIPIGLAAVTGIIK